MSRTVDQRVGEALGRWVTLCSRYPIVVLSIVALLTLVAGLISWRYMTIDSDLSRLIRPSESLAWYRDNEVYKAAFPMFEQTAVVVVSGPRASTVDASARRLRDALRDQGGFEFVFAPTLEVFFRTQRLYFLEAEDLKDWIEGVRYDYGVMLRLAEGADLLNAAYILGDQLSATPGMVLQHPLASLIRGFEKTPARIELEAYPHLEPEPGESGNVHALIVLKGLRHLDQSLPNAELVAQIRKIMSRVEIEPDVQLRLTGEVVLADEEISAALEGIGIAGTLSLVLLGVILGLGVRSLRTIIVIFGVLFTGVVLTLGYAVIAVGSFNTLALIFVVMFFGLGVDFAVHFTLRVREFGHRQTAVSDAAQDIGPALLLCVITTSIAFLSFVPTAYLGLGELGVISAGGMFIAFLLTLTLIPALYQLLGTPRTRGARTGLQDSLQNLRPGPTVLVALIVSAVALWFAKDLRFDYSVLAMRDASTEAMSTLLELQSDGVATDYSIAVLTEDSHSAHRLKQALEALPEVSTVQLPQDLVPSGQDEKHKQLVPVVELLESIGSVESGDLSDAAVEQLDEALEYLREVEPKVRPVDLASYQAFLNALAALRTDPVAFRALSEDLRSSLEGELADLRGMVAALPFEFSDLPADLRDRMITSDGRYLLSVQPAAALVSREETERFIQAVSRIAPNIAGRAVVEWGVGDVAVESFLEAVALSVTLILLLLVVYFRDLIRPVLVLVPLALATLLSFAIMEVSALSLNMANILVVPLIFGLGVDAGIHVVHRFSVTGSVHSIFESSTARAVMISALTTIGTFFSLSFSPHKGAASVGLLLSIAISLMLVATFIVLPALLRLFSRYVHESPGQQD